MYSPHSVHLFQPSNQNHANRNKLIPGPQENIQMKFETQITPKREKLIHKPGIESNESVLQAKSQKPQPPKKVRKENQSPRKP